jgi:hypothetical protein
MSVAKSRRQSSSTETTNTSPEFQHLIEQQRVKPVHDLDEISALWPPDHDPDALLEFLRQERTARRATKPRRKTA